MFSIKTIGLAILMVAGLFSAPATLAQINNYDDYARACRAEGGTPYPSPARCVFPSSGGTSSSSGGEALGEALGDALGNLILCVFGRCPGRDSDDDSATQQQQEEQERQRREARQRQEAERQAEAQRRAAETRPKKEEDERQARFILDRDATAGTLRGSVGTSIVSNAPGGVELRGSQIDTGIRDLKPDREVRDLSGAQAAWKRLHCAAAISGYALAALSDTRQDIQEFRYLADQALNALNGATLGVQCPTAPPMPQLLGEPSKVEKIKNTQTQIITRAVSIADRIRQTSQSSPPSQQSTAETDIERVRRVQRELNDVNSRKVEGNTAEQIRQRERDRQELARLVLINNKIETGADLTDVVFDTSDTSSRQTARQRPGVPTPAAQQ